MAENIYANSMKVESVCLCFCFVKTKSEQLGDGSLVLYLYQKGFASYAHSPNIA